MVVVKIWDEKFANARERLICRKTSMKVFLVRQSVVGVIPPCPDLVFLCKGIQ